MNTFKLNITPKWDPENQTLLFETEGMFHDIHREMVCFKDRNVRERLIAIGWTPPPAASSTPNQEGWWWVKSRLGFTCVRVRQLDGVWVGLNPYDGKEHPIHFPNDAFWDGMTWHGQVTHPSHPEFPRDTRNDGAPWTEPDRSGGGGHTPEEIDRARVDRY